MSIPAAEHPHDELAVLALDALAPAEWDAVEDHVRGCPACRAELEDYRSTLALVASDGVAPPPAMWDSIAERVGASGNGHRPGPLPLGSHPGRPAPAEPEPVPDPVAGPGVASLETGRERRSSRRSRRPGRAAALVAAAAAVVVVLGVAVGLRSQDGGTAGGDVVAAAEAAREAPGARVADLNSPEGQVVAEVVVDGDAPRFAVSEEPEGGSVSPTGAIVATGTFA